MLIKPRLGEDVLQGYPSHGGDVRGHMPGRDFRDLALSKLRCAKIKA